MLGLWSAPSRLSARPPKAPFRFISFLVDIWPLSVLLLPLFVGLVGAHVFIVVVSVAGAMLSLAGDLVGQEDDDCLASARVWSRW